MGDSEEYVGKTVLVTGGAGCIGSNLCKTLSSLGAKKVIILDNLSSAYEWNIPKADNIRFVKGDILDEDVLKKVFKDKPEYVFHLAAHFANQNSVDHPELDLMVNGMGILRVLQYAQKNKVQRFVYSSSGCGVYGLDSHDAVSGAGYLDSSAYPVSGDQVAWGVVYELFS
jgi:UDP-glucose 4-epimerase